MWSKRELKSRFLPLLVFALLLGVVLPIAKPPTADASVASVTAPSQPTFSLSTANQDPGDFVIAGFSSSSTLLVSIGFVDPPAGTSFSLPITTNLTASSGYNFTGGKTQISFTGSQADANSALAAMTVATGSTTGDITIRVTASLSVATVFYNPINNHYYEYFSTNVYAWNTPDTSTSAIHLAETKSRYGVTGYLATITNAQEQKFIYENFSYNDIWIGATDDYEVLNTRCAGTAGWSDFANQSASEGKWYWVTGPSDEKCKEFWRGAESSGLWINASTNAALAREAGNVSSARYENWCTGNSTPYTLTAGRSMGEPNNSGGNEQFALEKWGGAQCWNDWGTKGNGQKSYLVEYSGDFNDPATFATATLTARVSNAPRNVSAARATPALSGELVVSWQAPIGVTPTSYTVTSSPGGRTCTTTSLTCTVDGLTNGTSYTFTVVATFSDATTATSLASTAVSPASTPLSITYDPQGGSSISSGSSIVGGSIANSPGTPTREFHSFRGWFTGASGGLAITFPYTHGQTANFTLYAQWTDTRRTQSISLSGDTLDRSSTTTLSASGYSGTGEVTYSLSSGDCTLRGAVLTANGGSGTCVVDASIAADSTYQSASTSATFTLRTRQSQSISLSQINTAIVNSTPQVVTATASSGLTVSITSSTPSVCTVSSGTVRAVARGTCTIVASQGGNSTFLPAPNLAQSFTITGFAQSITFPQPPSLTTVSEDQRLSATSSSGLSVSFRTTTPTICAIQNAALAPIAVGNCVVVAFQAGDGTYSPADEVTRDVVITFVAKESQKITISQLNAMIIGDSPQTLSVFSTTREKIQLNVGPTTVCSLNSQQQVVANSEGECIVSTSQAGTRQYLSATQNASFTIFKNDATAKRATALQWMRPTAIDDKTALGLNQLNAYASVPGSFKYSPASGTILQGGIQDLSVTFTPNDRSRFMPATMIVKILILRTPANLTPTPTPSPAVSTKERASLPEPLTINFTSGSSKLRPNDQVSLTIYAKALNESGVTEVIVAGFTDNVGRENLKLSAARAEAVKQFLARISPNLKISAKSFGSSKPIASNRSNYGKSLNRRATVTPKS